MRSPDALGRPKDRTRSCDCRLYMLCVIYYILWCIVWQQQRILNNDRTSRFGDTVQNTLRSPTSSNGRWLAVLPCISSSRWTRAHMATYLTWLRGLPAGGRGPFFWGEKP